DEQVVAVIGQEVGGCGGVERVVKQGRRFQRDLRRSHHLDAALRHPLYCPAVDSRTIWSCLSCRSGPSPSCSPISRDRPASWSLWATDSPRCWRRITPSCGGRSGLIRASRCPPRAMLSLPSSPPWSM